MGDPVIAQALKSIAQKHSVPALAAAVVTADGSVTMAAVGVRKAGSAEAVSLDEVWHLGSCGKAMTATLAARLVEKGLLDWDTTVGELFPELAPPVRSGLGGATLAQLLSHRSGLPRDHNYRCYRQLREAGSPPAQRREAIKRAAAKGLLHPPGSNYVYSGYGYVVVAAMIEKVLGTSYEEAMREHLFSPLNMTSAVFESPDLIGSSHVPWSHRASGWVASRRKIAATDPAVLRPAGCIRCSMGDWAKFVLHHLRGEEGGSDLLSAETYRRLHIPPYGGDYGLGWAVYRRDWAGGRFLAHNGSNQLNFSQVIVPLKKRFAVLVCTNQNCSKATDEAAAFLIEMVTKGGFRP